MKNENPLTPEDCDLEAALARLQPAKTSIDRDRLMFLAGRRSVRRYGWIWPSIAALLAIALTVSLAIRPGTKPAQPADYVLQDSPTPTNTVTPSSPLMGQSKFSYIQLKNVILIQGIDALPMPELPPINGNPLSMNSLDNEVSPSPAVILSVFAKDLASPTIAARCFASLNMTNCLFIN